MGQKTLIALGLALALFQTFPTAVSAATKCYEDQVTPPELVCSGNDSSSADFSSGCEYTAGKIVPVEVECPSMWVNISEKNETHSQTCRRVGLRISEIEGSICASGELRPSSGQGWESISYRFGRWGGLDAHGGHQIEKLMDGVHGRDKDNPGTFREGGLFCYERGGTRDSDNTDRVVAYACGP